MNRVKFSMTKIMQVPAVLMINTKYNHNIGGAIRACSCWGFNTLLWTGERVDPKPYERLPREERMKGYKSVEWTRTDRPFDLLPKDVVPVCVELMPTSMPLTLFEHPENAVYVFGPEDGHVPQVYRRFCHHFVHIPTHHCLNVAVAINVTLAHRRIQRQMNGKEEILPLEEMLHEHRGVSNPETPVMDAVGWDGR